MPTPISDSAQDNRTPTAHSSDVVPGPRCGNQDSSASPRAPTECPVQAMPVPPQARGRRAPCGEKHLGGTVPARCPMLPYYNTSLADLSIRGRIYVHLLYDILIDLPLLLERVAGNAAQSDWGLRKVPLEHLSPANGRLSLWHRKYPDCAAGVVRLARPHSRLGCP